MEDVIEIISISDLLNLSLPLAGAVSLLPASTSSLPPKRRKPNVPGKSPMNPPLFAPDENPNRGNFSSLGRPVLLVGTVELFPWDSERSIGCFSHCVSFSDGSSRVCCYFLDFDPKAIGRKIHVLAWIFLPCKHNTGGVLEVIRWSFPDSEVAFDCDSSLSISSTISPQAANSKANARASGILRAVSPIFCVPCVKENDDRQKKSGAGLMDSGDAIGFLAEIVTCVCSLCSDSCFVSEHCRPSGDINSHSFTNSVYIYFIMPTHVWRPVLYRQIGELITISWLKKKMVLVGSEVSYPMFVSTAVTTVSFTQLPVNAISAASRIRSDSVMYNGVVTGIYMQGMVIELDDKIWLLITDPALAPQHSLRVGTIVRRQISVRNFHLVCAKYSWLRILLIGTCLRTCISTKSFSTSEIRCHFKPENTSLLEKFIESLTFSAKFWVLLLVSCFKKKFAGMFSHKDILGSKKKEGLVQTYARRILLPNNFLVKSGLFMNFCKHGQCSHRSENISFLKLVIPISNLTSWCEAAWVSMLSQEHNANVAFGTDHYSDQFFPRGTMHNHMIRQIIMSDEIGFILMGTFKISPYSGRLQLTDATGSIDVVMPDSPLSVDFQTVYEIKDYKLVMEGSSKLGDDLQYRFDEPLSCRSIFQQFSHEASLELALYVHFFLKDSQCVHFSPHFPSYVGDNESFKCINGEIFHLFYVTHKFPVYQSFQDDLSLSNSSDLFAEALLLPYNIIPTETGEHDEVVGIFLDDLDENFSNISLQNETTKRWFKQLEQANISKNNKLSGSLNVSREDERSCQVLCSFVYKSSKCQWSQLPAYLHYVHGMKEKDALYSRVLLQFKCDNFSQYYMLRIGSYYLLKCSKNSLDCKSNVYKHISHGQPLVVSEPNLWSLSFLFDKAEHQTWDDCSYVSKEEVNEVASENNCLGQMFLQFFDRTNGLSDVHLLISTESIRQFDQLESSLQSFLSHLPSAEIISVSSCIQNMIHEVVIPSGIIYPLTSELPQGIQISLRGNIENVVVYGCKPTCPVNSRCVLFCDHWSTCKVCFYVHDDSHKVQIRGSLSRYAYPAGLGPGANVTFHKVLLTRTSSIRNELELTPMSFIVVNTVKELCSQPNHRSVIQSSRWSVLHEHSMHSSSLGLVSNIQQCVDIKLSRLHCRVVNVIWIVLENETHESVELQSGRHRWIPAVNIPRAVFLLDDGSSLCTCWANYGRAETLLRVHESTNNAFFSVSELSRKKYSQNTVGHCLHKLLRKHNGVTIRNHGVESDFHSVDLAFSSNSHEVFSNQEERLLQFIILNACHASTFNIAGDMMDSNGLFLDNMEFPKYHQELKSMTHLRVKEVLHVNPVKEARNILNDLCKG